MSRNIIANHTTVSAEAKQEEKASEGKLIFSKYQDKNCAMLIKGTRLLAMQVLEEDGEQMGAIYVGKIKNVTKNMDACFVEIADGNVGFLSEKDSKYSYKLRKGDELLVQIKREAHQTKQIALTSHISISNEVAAISLGSVRVGYSTKLALEKKKQIKGWLEEEGLQENNSFKFEKIWEKKQGDMPCPDGVGIVVRTQAQDCDRDKFLQELNSLAEEFAALLQASLHRTCFSCVREAPPSFVSVLDKLVYPYEYNEIVTDDRTLYEQLKTYCETKACDKSVRFYEDSMISLSKLYSLEAKIETAFSTRIWLKSGGYLILQETEALTVIDVNSGKYEGKKGGFLVNCEAASEIARQLRLRNMGGIIIVDFINMKERKQREELLKRMKHLVHGDKQKTIVVDMTPLGLVEITRKREARTLKEQFANN